MNCASFGMKALIVLVLISLVHTSRSSQALQVGTFEKVKLSPGQRDMCGVDQPTDFNLVAESGSMVRCGVQCLSRPDCKAYNFNAISRRCDLYDSVPRNYSAVADCSGFTRKGNIAYYFSLQ